MVFLFKSFYHVMKSLDMDPGEGSRIKSVIRYDILCTMLNRILQIAVKFKLANMHQIAPVCAQSAKILSSEKAQRPLP